VCVRERERGSLESGEREKEKRGKERGNVGRWRKGEREVANENKIEGKFERGGS
jgi:hypothetical protein